MNDEKFHQLLTEEVKEWYRNQMGVEVPEWYASMKARMAFVLF